MKTRHKQTNLQQRLPYELRPQSHLRGAPTLRDLYPGDPSRDWSVKGTSRRARKRRERAARKVELKARDGWRQWDWLMGRLPKLPKPLPSSRFDYR